MSAWAIVREARARANLSQRALADRAQTAQSEIARIETGRQGPSLATLERLVRAAGFDLKIELVPHDDHDERLIDAMLALPVEERLDSLEEQSELFASVKEVKEVARDASDSSEGEPLPGPRRVAFRPRAFLEVLVRHELRFVILGGVAERILGSPRTTDDFDFCPAMSRANLERLAAVLNEVDARFRAEGLELEGFPTAEPWSSPSFGSYPSLALITRYGFFDVWFRPDGIGGYDDLIKRAIATEVAGMKVKVAHLDDMLRNKQAIGGPKYLSHLPLLRELQRRRREQGLP